MIAGDSIVVDARASVRHSWYEGSGTESDIHHYTLSYRIPPGDGPAGHAIRAGEVRSTNSMDAGFSSDRLLRVHGYSTVDNSPDWSAEVAQAAGREWRVVRSWAWPHRAIPPMAASTDGRYLALTEKGLTLIDLATMESKRDERLAAMFDVARGLDPRTGRFFLTNRLSYLVVQFWLRDSNGAETFSVGGKQYLRGTPGDYSIYGPYPYYAYVDRRSLRVGVFPAVLPREAADYRLGAAFEGAGETDDGQLLLYYGEPVSAKNTMRYIIRDERLNVLHEITLPVSLKDGEFNGVDSSFDPTRHRVLIYSSLFLRAPFMRYPAIMKIWDYEAGTVQTVTLDVGADFSSGFGGYRPK